MPGDLGFVPSLEITVVRLFLSKSKRGLSSRTHKITLGLAITSRD